jgi:hypothetical protein
MDRDSSSESEELGRGPTARDQVSHSSSRRSKQTSDIFGFSNYGVLESLQAQVEKVRIDLAIRTIAEN